MNTSRWRVIPALAAFLAVVPAARAQRFGASIGYVYPAGGQQGTTFQVTIGGQNLTGVSGAIVSGKGVQAKVLEHNKLVSQGQLNKLKDELAELQKKRMEAYKSSGKRTGAQATTRPSWTPEDEKRLAEIRKIAANFIRKPASAAIAEQVIVEVTIAPEADPGRREIRLGVPNGLTNPMVFYVGQILEVSEKPSKVCPEQVLGKESGYRDAKGEKDVPEVSVKLPAVMNGQITPGDVDRYRFPASKGQHLVIAAAARDLIPYISDAVPGWFQATLALYDAKGNELAYDDDFRFNPDPVLFCEIPVDGEYVIEIKDAIYRGREDFVYRITAGEIPFVASVFPLGGKAGERVTVEVTGSNLPADKLTMDVGDKEPGAHPFCLRKDEVISNRAVFAVDTLPECLEKEPNNQPAGAQQVALPIIVNGRIEKPGDVDVFRFEGRAGSEVVAEVRARRLNSPLDSTLRLTDSAGRQVAFNDDCEDKGAGLTTHHADSCLRAALPADGTYYLYLNDAQHQYGREYAYRLRISPPRPDFELRVVPSSLSVRPGAASPLTVYALRKDGFSDDITLALKGAPSGFTLSGAWIPAGQDQVRITLTASATLKEPLPLQVEGRAKVQGQDVVRTAVPAEDMMQAFAYRHLVPTDQFTVNVMGKWAPKTVAKVVSASPVKIPAGGSARVQVSISSGMLFGKLHLELSEPPDGIALQNVSQTRDSVELTLQGDAAAAKPGLKGNLIVNAFSESSSKSSSQKSPSKRRSSLGTLPAIPFEIVAGQNPPKSTASAKP